VTGSARSAALTLAAVLLAGCGSAGARDDDTITVFAASSLTEPLTEIAAQLEADGADVRLSFAGSPTLVAQVRQGAPADLVVTADERTMASLADLVDGEPRVVARNALAVAVPTGNPARIASLSALAEPGTDVVLAAPEVPAGRAAREALEAAGVVVRPVSEEPDVKAVLAKVRLGAADAGLVYASDLQAADDDVDGFVLPGVVNTYPAAVLRRAANPSGARALLDVIVSDAGRQVLREHGFLPP
jgi:molybdate transport system substrate-binding protein